MDQRNQQSGAARFFRGFFLIVRNYFIVVGIVATLIPLLLLWGLSSVRFVGAEAPDLDLSKDRPSQLEMDLSGVLTQEEPDISHQVLSQFFGDAGSLYIPEIRSVLRKARRDERVAGLQVKLGVLSGSASEFVELRRLFEKFRESGKTIRTVVHEPSEWKYFLASASDHITITPTSSVVIPGPLFTLTYFGEALRKLGVRFEVLKSGKYKSAFEPFVRNDPSDAALQQYRSMEQSLRTFIVNEVAASRGVKPAEVRDWYRQSIFTPEDALDRGLVDALGYSDPLEEDEDKKATDEKDADGEKQPTVDFSEYAQYARTEIPTKNLAEGNEGLAVVEATGEIKMAPSGTVPPSADSDAITPEALTRKLRWAHDADQVKAVVLRVNSPGGSATASDLIWREVERVAQKKPVVVSMGRYAASGGYYISAAAQKIVADPTTVTGSIGVIGMVPDLSGFEKEYGISFHVVTQSERKSLFNPGEPSSGFDKTLLQSTIAQTYQTFVQKVAKGRGMSYSDVESIAGGRVYTGIEAQKLGLVDELGGLQKAFNEAKELAGLDPKKLYPLHRYPRERFSLMDCLRDPLSLMKCLQMSKSQIGIPGLSHTLPELEKPRRIAEKLREWRQRVNQGRPLALWPGYLGLKL